MNGTPIERAHRSLAGLHMGDAFGGTYFWKPEVRERIRQRELQPPPWRWSDDAAMGRSVVQCLERHQGIDPNALATLFAQEYQRDPMRGYGTMAHSILDRLGQGVPWEQAAGEVFDGSGSYGNGAAMRVAPVGAYFADDIEQALHHALLSAKVTHAHLEGQAGALAVAAAAVWASQENSQNGEEMLAWAWTHTPEGETRSNLQKARDLPLDREPEEAASLLGSGDAITSQDTVPFALWCAARHLDSYCEALWTTVAGLGDLDTTCAIVGSLVILSAQDGIPEEWTAHAESMS